MVMRNPWLRLSLAVFLAGLSATPSPGHPVSITTADVEVRSNRVEVAVGVMLEDYFLLYGFSANADYRLSRTDLLDGIKRHEDLLLRDIRIRDRDGRVLTGRVERVEIPGIPETGVPMDELMGGKTVYHLAYPTPAPPDYLTFQQRIGVEQGAFLPSVMQMTVRQEGREALPEMTLSGEGNVETCEFDWGGGAPVRVDPGSSPSPAEPPRSMGIESYSSVYAFIYIEPAEVRVEILLPLLTLESWVPLTRASKDFLEVEEQKAAAEVLRRFFQGRNQVLMDGVQVAPEVKRLDFYGVDFKDFAVRAEPRRLSAWSARVGVILAYSTKGATDRVDITWDLFNERVLSARAAVFDGSESRRNLFSSYKPSFAWRNAGRPAQPEVAPVRMEKPDAQARAVIAETLLRNVYRAFDHRDEKLVYDVLARSVTGDLLAETYLKIHAGLLMAEQGGAVSRVDEVTPVSTEVSGTAPDAFTARMKWRVAGTVEHWGHIHTRVNACTADLSFTREENAWKIKGMNVGGQERVGYQIKVRKF